MATGPVSSPPSTATVPLDQTGTMTLDKSATLADTNQDGRRDAGDVVTYSYRVVNTGTLYS